MISRRRFVSGLATEATASLGGIRPTSASAEPAPETPALRLPEIPALGWAPRYVAEELLRAEAIKVLRYDKWREYDPEDTVRFCALRLHEVGMTKSGPQKIIAQGTNWRFLNELKKERKG